MEQAEAVFPEDSSIADDSIASDLGTAAEPPSNVPALRVAGDQVVEPLPVVPLSRSLLGDDLASKPEGSPLPTPRSSSCGGVVVKLITASHDPAASGASLAPSPTVPATVHRVGDRVGSYTVAAIEWDRVLLARGGSRCGVTVHPGLGASELDPPAPPRGTRRPALPGDEREEGTLSTTIMAGIEKHSETEFSVLDGSVQAIFAHGAQLLQGVRIEPVLRDGHSVGIALDAIQDRSLLGRLGIESGDLLLSINGEPSPSGNAALDALRHARQTTRAVARLERHGEAFELEIRVR
jgi:type II secretory pathway component PulC